MIFIVIIVPILNSTTFYQIKMKSKKIHFSDGKVPQEKKYRTGWWDQEGFVNVKRIVGKAMEQEPGPPNCLHRSVMRDSQKLRTPVLRQEIFSKNKMCILLQYSEYDLIKVIRNCCLYCWLLSRLIRSLVVHVNLSTDSLKVVLTVVWIIINIRETSKK